MTSVPISVIRVLRVIITRASAQAASSKASDYVDGVDIIIGSASSAADLSRLKSVIGVPLGGSAPGLPPNVTQSLNSK